MHMNKLRISNRPSKDGLCYRGERWLLARILRGVALGFCLVGALATAVCAQPPRIDPGDPPATPGGSVEAWQVLTIPGLPAGAMLGDVWAAPNGDVYVWANYPTRTSATLGEPVEGEKLPNPGGSHPRSSTLYRYDGINWTAMLSTRGETGNALYGTDAANVYASTTSALGEVRLYRFDGKTWAPQAVPGYYLGRKHTLAGVPGDMYFRIDRVILHDNGRGLQYAYEMPGEDAPVRGLVYADDDCVMMLCPDGFVAYDKKTYKEIPAGFDFADVEDAWGMVNPQGALEMYVVGSNAQDNGIRVWKYTEENPVTHAGAWQRVVSDPPTDEFAEIGCGMHIWGAASNDVYATGVVAGEGHMFHFDGNAWVQLVSPVPFGAVHGVWGSKNGVSWFSTDEGKLIRYQRANRAPDVTHAIPSVDQLWPPDLRLVPVDILGIIDADQDAVNIQITGVRSDEYPVTKGVNGACPDAVVNGAQVSLRAEHADNGDGRTYEIEFRATDRLGATSNGRVLVCAPHYVTSPCDNEDVAVFDAMAPCGVPQTLEAKEVAGAMEIRYELAEATRIHLGVYDLAGRLRATVEEGFRTSGVHETNWDSASLIPGMYFVKLRANGPAFTRRVVVLR